MIKESFGGELLDGVLDGFRSNLLNDDHARVGDKGAPTLGAFFQVLFKTDGVVKKQRPQ